MTIAELKKKFGITNQEIADMFGMSRDAFQNSSAKKRYEEALCRFYEFIKNKRC